MRWRDGVRLAAHALAWRVRARLTRRDREAELDEEIQAHLALLADEHRRRGLSEAEAQRAARRDFGGAEQVREACRDLRRAPILDTIVADLRYAWRTLRRQPGFTAAAVATFALGIGASTAIYTVIHEAVLAPLPFPNADGIVWVVNSWHGSLGGLMNVEYQAWERQSRSFSRTAVYATRQVTLAGAGSAERVSAGTVSARFFSVLGVAPALGRDFQPGETRSGANGWRCSATGCGAGVSAPTPAWSGAPWSSTARTTGSPACCRAASASSSTSSRRCSCPTCCSPRGPTTRCRSTR